MTTGSARSLYPVSSSVRVWLGKLDRDRVGSFLQQEAIAAIVDASHPYAVEISRLSVETARKYNLPYLRYERPAVELPPGVVRRSSVEDLLGGSDLDGERVLLTIGYRFLAQFRSYHDRAVLFARILPSIVALNAAIEAGFGNDRIIALRPPVSAALETALWQQWQISTVVTKASGRAGGEDVKYTVAQKLGVKLVVLDRPTCHYPQQTESLETAIAFCQSLRSN